MKRSIVSLSSIALFFFFGHPSRLNFGAIWLQVCKVYHKQLGWSPRLMRDETVPRLFVTGFSNIWLDLCRGAELLSGTVFTHLHGIYHVQQDAESDKVPSKYSQTHLSMLIFLPHYGLGVCRDKSGWERGDD